MVSDDDIESLRQEILMLKISLAEEKDAMFLGPNISGGAQIPMDGGDVGYAKPYDIVAKDEDDGGGYKFDNCYVMAGGKLMNGPTGDVDSSFSGMYVAIRISEEEDDEGTEIASYSTLSEMQSDQSDGVAVVPLYKFGTIEETEEGGISIEVECDFRCVPHMDSWSIYS